MATLTSTNKALIQNLGRHLDKVKLNCFKKTYIL